MGLVSIPLTTANASAPNLRFLVEDHLHQGAVDFNVAVVINHAYPVYTQAFPYPLPLVSVAEFQFRYNNRQNTDIFGAVIGGC